MATHNVTRAAHKTLTGTTIDTVNLSRKFAQVKITNRDSTDVLWVTVGNATTASANPVAEADDIDVVMPGESIVLPVPGARQANPSVKVLGDGGAYSVSGV